MNLLGPRESYNDEALHCLASGVSKTHRRSQSSLGHEFCLVESREAVNLKQAATSKIFNPHRNDSQFSFRNYNRDYKQAELVYRPSKKRITQRESSLKSIIYSDCSATRETSIGTETRITKPKAFYHNKSQIVF